MQIGNIVRTISKPKKTHCENCECRFSQPFYSDETFQDHFGTAGSHVHFYTCSHPDYEDYSEEPTVENCPLFLEKFNEQGFLYECLICDEFEYCFCAGEVEMWCNDDRLFECALQCQKMAG